jgi:hypothetical protein
MTKTFTATPKQLAIIPKLLKDRVVPTALATEAQQTLASCKIRAKLISELLACPKALVVGQVESVKGVVQPGYYLLDGKTPCVVVLSKAGQPYAKILVAPAKDSSKRARWDYERGAVFRLAGQTPLTVEQASEWGHLHGYCLCCGVPIDEPLSVKVGIGPSCVKKHFGMTQTQFLAKKQAAQLTAVAS